MTTVCFQIYHLGSLGQSWESETPVSVGRQNQGEPAVGPYESPVGNRAIVATMPNRGVPRQFFQVDAEEGQLVLRNTHPQCEVVIKNQSSVAPGDSIAIHSSISVMINDSTILQISPKAGTVSGSDSRFRSLASMPLDPADVSMVSMFTKNETLMPDGKSPSESTEMLELLQQVLPVVRESVTSDSFFKAAAFAATRIANLNRAVVLLFVGSSRITRAEVYEDSAGDNEASALRNTAPPISDSMIRGVRDACLTKMYGRGADVMSGQSLQMLHQAVCSPILNKDREVIGVLYGDRWTGAAMRSFTEVEAKLVEILACAISAGIARQDEERQRSSMEAYFPDVVAKHIVDDATLLDPKEENVTLMFADVRKFSSISKILGPTKTIEWMQDMFTVLSECVEETAGIVINYVGDELIAMWGAPEPQADHAQRGLATAQSMMHRLKAVEKRWKEKIPEPLRVGIGLNSGLAAVGNTGSTIKFQYGVFGNVVNIASRLQSATKQFGVDCLVSASTAKQAGDSFHLRELATITVVGINEEIVVSQLTRDPDSAWDDLCKRYGSALRDYQQMHFADATQTLGKILSEYPDDEPSMRLLGLSVAQLRHPPDDFSPIDSLTIK